MGALVVRKMAVVAHGETASAPFEPGYESFRDALAWASRIERIVLLGGMSKGWTPGSARTWLLAVAWGLYTFVATLLPARRGLLMECRFGLPFSVQTRLQWLALVREKHRVLPMVQLLGSLDNLVSPDDMIDVAVDNIANGVHVVLDLPATTHTSTIHMADEPGASKRQELFQKALTEDMTTLATNDNAASSTLLADGSTPRPDDDVTDVVFVVHGIRDKGFWTMKIARAIKRDAALFARTSGVARHVRSMTQSYGYLAMLPFVWVGVRRMKTAWLMDRYVDARSRYPKAVFHFVGHSNGTYLAARALLDYPAASFDRIVFAGSVVRCDYDWRRLIEATRPQVRSVLNYVASSDLVVGIFPAALGWFDLGGAGHAGFRDIAARPKPADVPRVAHKAIGAHNCYQVHYVRGGHGAGIVETQWDEIAAFIVRGDAPAPVNSDYVGRQGLLSRLLGGAPPFGLVSVIGIYALIVYCSMVWLPVALVPLTIVSAILLLRV